MTTATNLVEGEVLIAGDLSTASTGDSPELRPSGVQFGVYSYSSGGLDGGGNAIINIPTAVIDSKGRIIHAVQKQYTMFNNVLATTSTFGTVKPDNVTITVAAGVISALASSIPTATSSVLGKLRPDNTTMSVNNGVLSTILPTATSSVLGISKPDNVSIFSSSGVLTLGQASSTLLGAARPGASMEVNAGVLSIVTASPSVPGVASINGDKLFEWEGKHYPHWTTTGLFGIVQPDNVTMSVSNGVLSSIVTKASSSIVGVVKADENNLTINAGVISIKQATLGVNFGTVIPDPATLSIDGTGKLSIKAATSSNFGPVKVSDTSIKSTAGTVYIPDATSSTTGAVRPDNTSVSIADGVISRQSIPTATSSTTGLVTADSSLTISAGTISIPAATSVVKGSVRSNDTTTTILDGVISANIPVVAATSSVAGHLQVDNTTISISLSGVMSTISPFTSPSVFGYAKVDNSTLNITSSKLQARTATSALNGVVKTGGSFEVTNGIVNIVKATSTIRGAVKLDSSIESTAGVISLPKATSSTYGIVKTQSSGDILSLSGGVLSCSAMTTSHGPFTATQSLEAINFNNASGEIYYGPRNLQITVQANSTVNYRPMLPDNTYGGVNACDGQEALIIIRKSLSSYTVTLGSYIKTSPGFVLPTFTSSQALILEGVQVKVNGYWYCMIVNAKVINV